MIDGDRVIHETRYPHPPERVWRALTEPAELHELTIACSTTAGEPYCHRLHGAACVYRRGRSTHRSRA